MNAASLAFGLFNNELTYRTISPVPKSAFVVSNPLVALR